MSPFGILFLVFFTASISGTVHAQSRPSMVPPRLVSIPNPDCRGAKACHGGHGQVCLIVDVLEDGKVGEIRVELGDARLAEAATAAVLQAEFSPGSYLGKPQNMDFVVNLNF